MEPELVALNSQPFRNHSCLVVDAVVIGLDEACSHSGCDAKVEKSETLLFQQLQNSCEECRVRANENSNHFKKLC